MIRKEKSELANSPNHAEVLEFIKTARTLKRQIKLVRGINLNDKEVEVIKKVLTELDVEFTLFNV